MSIFPATLQELYGGNSRKEFKMEKIDDMQLFELFQRALECCGMFLLNCDPQDIEYFIFEEFDGDCSSFLHEISLSKLFDYGHISAEVYSKCRLLYKKFRQMEGTIMWNANSVKTSPEWRVILSLSDEIKSMIHST